MQQRVLVDFEYLENNFTQALKTRINNYFDSGAEVLFWFKYIWVGNTERLTTDRFNEIQDFLEDRDIKNHGILINFDEEYLLDDLRLKADVYIPERSNPRTQ